MCIPIGSLSKWGAETLIARVPIKKFFSLYIHLYIYISWYIMYNYIYTYINMYENRRCVNICHFRKFLDVFWCVYYDQAEESERVKEWSGKYTHARVG